LTDATAAFFEDLKHRGHEPLLARKRGSVRIEITNGRAAERWLVEFDDGEIGVSKRNSKADTTLRIERKLFGKIATGEANAMTALLRGEISAEGDVDVLAVFQRLLR
jgi:putative sterol carrier protein